MDEPVKLLPPSCSGRWKAELREIGQLAGPIAISNFFGVFMQLTDLAFIGHLGADSLAAAALGAKDCVFSAQALGHCTTLDITQVTLSSIYCTTVLWEQRL